MKEIILSQGKIAMVDDDDYEVISSFKWCAQKISHGKYRAARYFGKRYIYMHRFILDVDKSVLVDHRDGNPLNNCRSNLRAATPTQNQYNRGCRLDSESGIKGVKFRPHAGKWQAYITIRGKLKHLGYFPTKELAAKERGRAELALHGEFAYVR